MRLSRTSSWTVRCGTVPLSTARRSSPIVVALKLDILRFYLVVGYRRRRVPFFAHSRPLVFAHRGGSALGPENTLTAFDLGLRAGADGLELDVHLSADGVAVVHHDPTLDRTTSATGPVATRTADELARVDAGHHFSDGRGHPFRGQGIGVPTLREVLCRYRDTRVIIEMKVDSEQMAEAVAREVRAADAVERVCVAGFGLRSAAAVRGRLPGAACSACHHEVRKAVYRGLVGLPVGQVGYGGYQVPETSGLIRIISRRFVRKAHEAALKVQVWTVDDRSDMQRLLVWDVDGLITNRPDLAVVVRNELFP
jgi:glycerophosphoryl diester phosphodiesterase